KEDEDEEEKQRGLKLTSLRPFATLLAWQSQLWVAVLARCWVARPSFPNQRRLRPVRPQLPPTRPRRRALSRDESRESRARNPRPSTLDSRPISCVTCR